MAYTPELSYEQSCTLRRIAWALGMPMTKAIGEVIDYACNAVEQKKVCEACRDKTRCEECAFDRKRKERRSTDNIIA